MLAYFAPKEADALRKMAEAAAGSRVAAGVQYPSDAAAGLDLGRKAAAASIEAAKNDNYDTANWDGKMPEGPGIWKGQNPVGVTDRFWKPFVVPSADALRPPPPPAPRLARAGEGGRGGQSYPRTPTSTGLAIWVEYQLRGRPNFNIVWNRELSRRVFEEHLEDNPWAARGYALLHAAYQDAWITTQDAKFAYWTARPSMFDPTITTVVPVPNHPSYPRMARPWRPRQRSSSATCSRAMRPPSRSRRTSTARRASGRASTSRATSRCRAKWASSWPSSLSRGTGASVMADATRAAAGLAAPPVDAVDRSGRPPPFGRWPSTGRGTRAACTGCCGWPAPASSSATAPSD